MAPALSAWIIVSHSRESPIGFPIEVSKPPLHNPTSVSSTPTDQAHMSEKAKLDPDTPIPEILTHTAETRK